MLKFQHCQNFEDLVGVRELAESAHYESDFSHLGFCQRKADQFAEKILTSLNDKGLLTARSNGKCIGLLYCTSGDYFMGAGSSAGYSS